VSTFEIIMLMRRALLLVVFVSLASSLAHACSCSNPVPIQSNSRRYAGSAVFTARVVQLLGTAHARNGKRYAQRALAVVQRRYWGLPWYWPKVVVLDGGFLCNIELSDGDEYLVSGRRGLYGMLDVGGCSRTQPLKTAQIDMRALDGSRCAAPGGAIIGRVTQSNQNQQEESPVRNTALTFRDWNGAVYRTQSDQEVFEMRHLPAGPYALDSRFASGQYLFGGGQVTVGMCSGSLARLNPYAVTGKIIPGIDQYTRVDLIGPHEELPRVKSAVIAPDGRFYFETVPPGEYDLVATVDLVGRNQWAKIKYPVRVRISDQSRNESFDFDPNLLPLTPIPVIVNSPDPSHPIPIEIRSQDSAGNFVHDFRSVTGGPVFVVGVRGESYQISAFGYGGADVYTRDGRSGVVQVTAAPGMKPVSMSLKAP
jgi:hypothetical protein